MLITRGMGRSAGGGIIAADLEIKVDDTMDLTVAIENSNTIEVGIDLDSEEG